MLQLRWMKDTTAVDTATIKVPFFKNAVTIAGGNGNGSAPNQLYYPGDVFVDGNGNIYIYAIREIKEYKNGLWVQLKVSLLQVAMVKVLHLINWIFPKVFLWIKQVMYLLQMA